MMISEAGRKKTPFNELISFELVLFIERRVTNENNVEHLKSYSSN